MTVSRVNEGRGMLAYDIVGVAGTTGGGQGNIPNPEGVDLHILRVYILAKTESTGSGNLSVGVAADAVTSAADLLNADDMNGVTEGKLINGFAHDPGAKTEQVPAVWSSGKFVTLTGSASLVGFTGRIYIEYLRT